MYPKILFLLPWTHQKHSEKYFSQTFFYNICDNFCCEAWEASYRPLTCLPYCIVSSTKSINMTCVQCYNLQKVGGMRIADCGGGVGGVGIMAWRDSVRQRTRRAGRRSIPPFLTSPTVRYHQVSLSPWNPSQSCRDATRN